MIISEIQHATFLTPIKGPASSVTSDVHTTVYMFICYPTYKSVAAFADLEGAYIPSFVACVFRDSS